VVFEAYVEQVLSPVLQEEPVIFWITWALTRETRCIG